MNRDPHVRRLARLSFTATALAQTRRFYEALGFVAEPIEAVDGTVLAAMGLPRARAERLPMRLGRQRVEFLCFDPPGRRYPEGSTSTDLWFQHIAVVVSAMAEARRRVLAAGATPITEGGPQVLPPNTGRVAAFKFRDPDGHPLELLHFPPGQGAAVWQDRAGTSPFLGIDHTAIAVADPRRSRTFYESIGLSVDATSHNAGPAQERLDDVSDDRVRVVALMPPEALPHVELLGYETGLRRPMPPDTQSSDVWATRTVFAAPVASPCLVRDPDGHAILFLPEG